MLKLIFVTLVLFFQSCSEPVRRDEAKSENASTNSQSPIPPMGEVSDLKKTVWVFKFENQAPESHLSLRGVPAGEILQDEVRLALGSEKSPFRVQDADEEKALLTAAGLESETIDSNILFRNLRGSEVSGVILGKISRFEMGLEGENNEGIFKMRTVTLTLEATYELLDVSTGKVVARGRDSQSLSESRSDFLGAAPALNDIPVKVRNLSKSLAQNVLRRMSPFAHKLAWGGRVLRIEGGRVYLNAGRQTGLIVGDVLKVVERSREILDPQTGSAIGEAPGRMKGTVKIIQFFGTDGAVGILQSGGGVLPGDRVELF